jgi:hypothetical protein
MPRKPRITNHDGHVSVHALYTKSGRRFKWEVMDYYDNMLDEGWELTDRLRREKAAEALIREGEKMKLAIVDQAATYERKKKSYGVKSTYGRSYPVEESSCAPV